MMDNKITRIIFIDFENVKILNFNRINKINSLILLFIGQNQNKIPFELVKEAQDFGRNLEWIKIEGEGKNNLDFHIAYKLGYCNREQDRQVEFIVLSRDTGYDQLINYIRKSGRECRRISSLQELTADMARDPGMAPEDENTRKVLENLQKIAVNKRPRNRKTLIKHIDSLFKNRNISAQGIVEDLFARGLVTEKNNKITYNI